MNNLFLVSYLFVSPFLARITSKNIEEICPSMKRECVLTFYKDLRLYRRDPVEVGHISNLTLENGQIRKVKTLSILPPIFEISNFLSSTECDEIISIAEEVGLYVSSTIDEYMFKDEEIFAEEQGEAFEYYDHNKDGFMDVKEIIHLFDSELDFFPDHEDVVALFKDYKLDKDGDMLISPQEFSEKDVKGVIKFISTIRLQKPYTKSRNSNQTWLDPNTESSPLLHSIRKRVQILTQLPMTIINSSESLQVVSYGPRGHYNCHLDSDNIDENQTCCHFLNQDKDCRICRYLTVLYYLNDVEEGGETAFPVADNATFEEELFEQDLERICNVGQYCNKSNLRVKPEKGKAIFWYSHSINESTGWLGGSDPYSYHGGCDVIKGRKWIANTWIEVSENRTRDIEFWMNELFGSNVKDEIDENNNKDIDKDDDIFMSVLVEDGNDEIDSILDSVTDINYVHDVDKDEL